MDLTYIDRMLSMWDERLRQVDENLLALESDSTYQLVSAASVGRGVELNGLTREKMDLAIDAIGDLFEGRRKLAEVVDKAKASRSSISMISFWSSDDRVAEIEEQLVRPSIVLDLPSAPLSQRRLLQPGPVAGKITAEQLLAQMAQGFDRARDILLEVGRAWARIDAQLDKMAQQCLALDETATTEGLRELVSAELDAAQQMMDDIRDNADRDPLGMTLDIARTLTPVIESVQVRLDNARAIRERVTSRLNEAQSLLQRWRDQRADVESAQQTLPLEFVGVGERPISESSSITDHALWLERLSAAVQSGHFQSADVGLERWFQSASAVVALDDSVLNSFRSLMARRDELLGRLSARRAQAEALRRRGAVLDEGARLSADRAAQLLSRRPTMLADATDALESFEQGVAAMRC
ncbi:MAG: hypothetical protein U0165_09665 [Polyangiaceae bacterium]